MPTAFDYPTTDVGRMRFGDEPEAPPAEGEGDLSLFPRPVRRHEIIYVTNQLAIMVDTGVTLSAALGSILEQEQNPTLRRVLTDLRSAASRCVSASCGSPRASESNASATGRCAVYTRHFVTPRSRSTDVSSLRMLAVSPPASARRAYAYMAPTY